MYSAVCKSAFRYDRNTALGKVYTVHVLTVHERLRVHALHTGQFIRLYSLVSGFKAFDQRLFGSVLRPVDNPVITGEIGVFYKINIRQPRTSGKRPYTQLSYTCSDFSYSKLLTVL